MFYQQELARKRLLAPPKESLRLLASVDLNDEKRFFPVLERAFTTLLYEKGVIADPAQNVDTLPDSAQEVKRFFEEVSKARFAGKGKLSLTKVFHEAKKLFKSLEDNS